MVGDDAIHWIYDVEFIPYVSISDNAKVWAHRARGLCALNPCACDAVGTVAFGGCRRSLGRRVYASPAPAHGQFVQFVHHSFAHTPCPAPQTIFMHGAVRVCATLFTQVMRCADCSRKRHAGGASAAHRRWSAGAIEPRGRPDQRQAAGQAVLVRPSRAARVSSSQPVTNLLMVPVQPEP